MPSSATTKNPLLLVCGEEEFSVKQRAKSLYKQWCDEVGGMDHEIVDASAHNSDEALKAIAKLRQGLQTLPFFGSGKVVWFKDCNFLADDRVSAAAAVSTEVADLAQMLKDFDWRGVRLLISAGKVDKRKVFYKTIDKTGRAEHFEALSLEDREWEHKAEAFARSEFKARGKQIAEEALSELVQATGPNLQLLSSEAEKLSLFVAERERVGADDVAAVVSRHKQARAFALADALGDRNLATALKRLDEELWSMKTDRRKSEIGLLYGLISKVRAMLFVTELQHEGLLRPEASYPRFKSQIERLPADRFSSDKKFSPLGMNAFVLFRAAQQCANYSRAELVRAMEWLLDANLKLVSSGLDEALVLQQALAQIIGPPPAAKTGARQPTIRC